MSAIPNPTPPRSTARPHPAQRGPGPALARRAGLPAELPATPPTRAAHARPSGVRSTFRQRARRPARPAESPLLGLDLIAILVANAVIIAAMWIRHGGLELSSSTAGWLTAAGQLTGLYGAFAILVQLVLISRTPWIERRVGMPSLNYLHRWNGFLAMALLTAHAVTITLGYAWGVGISALQQTSDFILSYPNMLAAFVGFGLLVAVTVTSLRAIRRAVSYETWWFVHLYAYLGIGLSFAHQLSAGADFVTDPFARAYWIGLYVAVAVLLVGYRWLAPVFTSLRHQLRVAKVTPEAPGVVSIELSGRKLHRLRCEAGQFFVIRFLTSARWWKAQPFSLSAPPDGRTLRFTIKALGDDTSAIQRIEAGTRVAVEGPYGIFTAAQAADRKVALIAGGVGVTPIRALYETIERPPGDVALLYRTPHDSDAVLSDELTSISQQRGFGLSLSYSRRFGRSVDGDPFRPDRLLAWLPDLRERAVFLCGPPAMLAAARSGLRAAGVPAAQVHSERFDY